MEDVERVYTSEEIGDYESDRRRQYRADVESGARGIASVFRAMGNSVTWGVSSTGRGLSAIQSGVQNRWRRARNPRRPEPASEQDPDSLGDSDSDSEWDGSEPAVLLASTETPAAVESEAFVRQQGDASTSDSGRPGAEDTWEEPWETIKRWWNNPAFFRFRVSLSMANLTMALPAFIARVSAMYPTFVAGLHSQLLTSQLSLPIMAPLLFGGGIAFKAIMSNLGFVLPRLAMAGGVLWILWATNYAMQEAIAHLRNNGAIDRRISNVLVLTVELVASTIGLVTILSSVGVRISSLLLPGFAAVALAGKDVWHNYFAGFFLFAAQPFRPGDSVALLCGAGVAPPSPTSAVPPGWFEGVCESVDLRYTVLRNGRQRLLVPNAHFVNREFLVTDAGPVVTRAPPTARTDSPRGVKNGRAKGTPGGTNGPPGMPGQKVSPNGQDKRGGFMPTSSSNGGPGPMPSGPGIAVPWGK
ncbi:mechanosensitive ion channel [Klebsormidium nitens]|uniref:Mechanosensitive ion channel n=1 Tax=Klebsormidium nitens TaxID=105231 RepID=A0A1Y1I5Z7_KLENI|nr:mechanosensitive ion channel [Klebsormidium nitens]|eukprot:GAQ86384.1 mechanosensitive ion channel [Klebsormidium nitens]